MPSFFIPGSRSRKREGEYEAEQAEHGALRDARGDLASFGQALPLAFTKAPAQLLQRDHRREQRSGDEQVDDGEHGSVESRAEAPTRRYARAGHDMPCVPDRRSRS